MPKENQPQTNQNRLERLQKSLTNFSRPEGAPAPPPRNQQPTPPKQNQTPNQNSK